MEALDARSGGGDMVELDARALGVSTGRVRSIARHPLRDVVYVGVHSDDRLRRNVIAARRVGGVLVVEGRFPDCEEPLPLTPTRLPQRAAWSPSAAYSSATALLVHPGGRRLYVGASVQWGTTEGSDILAAPSAVARLWGLTVYDLDEDGRVVPGSATSHDIGATASAQVAGIHLHGSGRALYVGTSSGKLAIRALDTTTLRPTGPLTRLPGPLNPDNPEVVVGPSATGDKPSIVWMATTTAVYAIDTDPSGLPVIPADDSSPVRPVHSLGSPAARPVLGVSERTLVVGSVGHPLERVAVDSKGALTSPSTSQVVSAKGWPVLCVAGDPYQAPVPVGTTPGRDRIVPCVQVPGETARVSLDDPTVIVAATGPTTVDPETWLLVVPERATMYDTVVGGRSGYIDELARRTEACLPTPAPLRPNRLPFSSSLLRWLRSTPVDNELDLVEIAARFGFNACEFPATAQWSHHDEAMDAQNGLGFIARDAFVNNTPGRHDPDASMTYYSYYADASDPETFPAWAASNTKGIEPTYDVSFGPVATWPDGTPRVDIRLEIDHERWRRIRMLTFDEPSLNLRGGHDWHRSWLQKAYVALARSGGLGPDAAGVPDADVPLEAIPTVVALAAQLRAAAFRSYLVRVGAPDPDLTFAWPTFDPSTPTPDRVARDRFLWSARFIVDSSRRQFERLLAEVRAAIPDTLHADALIGPYLSSGGIGSGGAYDCWYEYPDRGGALTLVPDVLTAGRSGSYSPIMEVGGGPPLEVPHQCDLMRSASLRTTRAPGWFDGGAAARVPGTNLLAFGGLVQRDGGNGFQRPGMTTISAMSMYGRGARYVQVYAWGPTPSYPVVWSDIVADPHFGPITAQEIQRTAGLVAAAEDVYLASLPQPASVAVLTNSLGRMLAPPYRFAGWTGPDRTDLLEQVRYASGDLPAEVLDTTFDLTSAVFDHDQQGLTFALRLGQLALDFVDDGAVAEWYDEVPVLPVGTFGEIPRTREHRPAWDVAVVSSPHVSATAAARLERFVRDGGTLVLGIGAARFDEYGTPLASVDALVGATRMAARRAKPRAARLTGDVEIPGLRSKKDVTRPVDPRKRRRIDLIGPTMPMVTTTAEVVLEDSAGVPLVTRHAVGKGVVWTFGIAIGIEHGRDVYGFGQEEAFFPAPSDFDATMRALACAPMAGLVAEQRAHCTAVGIETLVVEGPDQVAVTLVNWTSTCPMPATVEVRVDGPEHDTRLASGGPVFAVFDGGRLRCDLTVDRTDVLLVTRRPQPQPTKPTDPRDDDPRRPWPWERQPGRRRRT